MTRMITFTSVGWEDYLYWQSKDKQIIKKINRLIQECLRDPFIGTGKPEPLRHELSGAWARRINDEHRLVYLVFDDDIRIISCRYHY